MFVNAAAPVNTRDTRSVAFVHQRKLISVAEKAHQAALCHVLRSVQAFGDNTDYLDVQEQALSTYSVPSGSKLKQGAISSGPICRKLVLSVGVLSRSGGGAGEGGGVVS